MLPVAPEPFGVLDLWGNRHPEFHRAASPGG